MPRNEFEVNQEIVGIRGKIKKLEAGLGNEVTCVVPFFYFMQEEDKKNVVLMRQSKAHFFLFSFKGLSPAKARLLWHNLKNVVQLAALM